MFTGFKCETLNLAARRFVKQRIPLIFRSNQCDVQFRAQAQRFQGCRDRNFGSEVAATGIQRDADHLASPVIIFVKQACLNETAGLRPAVVFLDLSVTA